MEKKIALIVGCIALYIILSFLTDGAIHIFLVLGGLGYAMYKNG